MNKITIVFLSILCYIVAPAFYLYIGFPMFFTGLDRLDIFVLFIGTVALGLVAVIPYKWTSELMEERERRKKVDS